MTNPHFSLGNAPRFPNIAELDYPKPVKKLIDQANKAYEVWADADTDLAVAIENLAQARNDYENSILLAARADAPRPVSSNFDDEEANIKYLAEVVRTKKLNAENAIAEMSESFHAHRVDIARLAVAKAEAGIIAYRESVNAFATSFPEIEKARRQAYDGLLMFSDLSHPEVRYEPNFGSGDSPVLPKTHESAASSIVSLIKQVFLTEPKIDSTPEVNE